MVALNKRSARASLAAAFLLKLPRIPMRKTSNDAAAKVTLRGLLSRSVARPFSRGVPVMHN